MKTQDIIPFASQTHPPLSTENLKSTLLDLPIYQSTNSQTTKDYKIPILLSRMDIMLQIGLCTLSLLLLSTSATGLAPNSDPTTQPLGGCSGVYYKNYAQCIAQDEPACSAVAIENYGNCCKLVGGVRKNVCQSSGN
ncbi:hypothetical protein MJO29_014105 [Puccinia striiformis f. sp. tritici]|uniref:hypothetical protein n=1 Tax=Puccinia striiformis f. sp. tritici TaxID=168172 RepID=UPI00200836F3|nr:hypothetical protein Pst134EA_026704 [Puccinia striiformis f. sp. tritici]KAH9449991.1 hypothetical protein Pst134EA_026704 [Puccinia striiformis f. sp. tritici]KAI7939369.1 hypothetical protein MJO29_014105 [Puccinia striiformis f. sp. tritici]